MPNPEPEVTVSPPQPRRAPSVSSLTSLSSSIDEEKDAALLVEISELEQMSLITKDHSLAINVIEAKNIDISDQCNTYAVIKPLNMEQARTKVVKKNKNPLWNDDFYFSLKGELKDVKVVVWEERRVGGDRALGMVNLPHSEMVGDHEQHERWFPLQPADSEGVVTGQLLLDLRYVSGDTRDHLVVNLRRGKALVKKDQSGRSDPYVVMHLLPDEDLKTTVKSKVQKGTLDPDFNEQFNFVIPIKDGEPKHNILHISVWDWDRFSADDFMGQAWIFLGNLKAEWDRPHDHEWITLLPRTTVDPLTPTTEPQRHNFSTHSYKSPTWCAVCDGLLWGAVRQGVKCRECGINSHEKCSVQFPENCRGDKLKKFRPRFSVRRSTGLSKAQEYILEIQDIILASIFEAADPYGGGGDGDSSKRNGDDSDKGSATNYFGQARIRYRYTEEPVFPASTYEGLYKMLDACDMYLLWLLQGAVVQKQEVAASLVRVFEHHNRSVELLQLLARKEIHSTTDPNTIFRGNTIVTKSFDAFLKLHGQEYLQATLNEVIDDIMSDPVSCEMDPTRCSEKDQDRFQKNLRKHVNAVLDAIFRSAIHIPPNFRLIFSDLRREVVAAYPTDALVCYTAISGFLFLRFFCPATLGPQLFGLCRKDLSEKTARDLTLVAKTLQNLANMAEFGGKEPYMTPMNELLQARMGEMKQFLNAAATPVDAKPEAMEISDCNMYMSRLYRFFHQAEDKMVILHEEAVRETRAARSTPESEIFAALRKELKLLKHKHSKAREKLADEHDERTMRHRSTIQMAADGWKTRKLDENGASLRRLCAQIKAALVSSSTLVEDIISASNALSVAIRQLLGIAEKYHADPTLSLRVADATQSFKIGIRSLAQLSDDDFAQRRTVALRLVAMMTTVEQSAETLRSEVTTLLQRSRSPGTRRKQTGSSTGTL